jgi:heat-inducible transcriptional repressor
MSELCEMGYLEQPHTSAGRLPTSKAYRLYVSELMKKDTLSNERKQIIDDMLASVSPDPEKLGSSAAAILSELTGLPAISAASEKHEATIKRVTLLPMGKSSAIVFAITDDGRARSQLVRCDSPLTASLLTRFDNIVREKVCKRGISTLDTAYLQSIAVSAGFDALSLVPLLSCVFDMAKDIGKAEISLNGAANLLSVFRVDTDAKRIIELLRKRDAVYNIFSGVTDSVGIVLGDDTGYTELKPTGMIIASYGDERELGRLAVIGPTRMSYERILPSVEYLAGRIGNIMSEVLKGLEE